MLGGQGRPDLRGDSNGRTEEQRRASQVDVDDLRGGGGPAAVLRARAFGGVCIVRPGIRTDRRGYYGVLYDAEDLGSGARARAGEPKFLGAGDAPGYDVRGRMGAASDSTHRAASDEQYIVL